MMSESVRVFVQFTVSQRLIAAVKGNGVRRASDRLLDQVAERLLTGIGFLVTLPIDQQFLGCSLLVVRACRLG